MVHPCCISERKKTKVGVVLVGVEEGRVGIRGLPLEIREVSLDRCIQGSKTLEGHHRLERSVLYAFHLTQGHP